MNVLVYMLQDKLSINKILLCFKYLIMKKELVIFEKNIKNK